MPHEERDSGVGGGLGTLSEEWLDDGSLSSPQVGTLVRPDRKPEPRDDERAEELPPHAVIVHNDDLNTFDHVARCLKKVFGYSWFKGMRIAWQVHNTGQATVWTGPLEHAELKAEQLVSCGPTPEMRSRGAQALRVTVEPLAD